MALDVERDTRIVRAPDGTGLAVHEVAGPGDPVLVLPGGPGRASVYLEDLGGLSAVRRLALLDTRGSGRSEVPSDPATMRADGLARDVDTVRDALGLATADVVGHSAGCLTAMLWAAFFPQRVRSLVLVNPPAGFVPVEIEDDTRDIRERRAGEPWYADAQEASAALAAGDAPASMRGQLERALRPFFYGAWDERQQEHAAAADREVSPRPAAAFADGLDPDAVRQQLNWLSTLATPVLVVAGELDGMTGAAAAPALAAAFPQGTSVVLPGAGHFPWVDAPDAFRDALGGVLAA